VHDYYVLLYTAPTNNHSSCVVGSQPDSSSLEGGLGGGERTEQYVRRNYMSIHYLLLRAKIVEYVIITL
jgi:hypothetical protein